MFQEAPELPWKEEMLQGTSLPQIHQEMRL